MFVEPIAHFGHDEDRPYPSSSESTGMRVPAKPAASAVAAGTIERAGQGDADVGVAEIAFLDDEALFRGIVAAAHGDAVEHQRVACCAGGGRERWCRRRCLNGQIPPACCGASRWANSVMRSPPDRIWNGTDNRRVAGVPIELELGAIDGDAPRRREPRRSKPASATIRPVKVCGTPSGRSRR